MADKQIKYKIGFDVDKSGLKEAKQELKRIASMEFKDLKLINKNATVEDFKEIRQAAQNLGIALENSFNPKLNSTSITKFNEEIKKIAGTGGLKTLEASFAKIGVAGKQAFRNATSEVLTTQKAVKQTSKLLDSMANTLANTAKWSIASGAINLFTNSIRNAWNYAIQLDKSLNDIRIVTNKSADDMEKFAKQANRAAKSLGSTTQAYTKASLIYYQQGLGEDDVQARTKTTIKAANVTGQSAAEVSEQLTAVWNGYKVVADEAESYVDKLAAVAASTAADLEELSDGMSKVASAANAMGVDIDQLAAQISTIVSVTRQDASVVGTALKTIFARMGDLKVDGVDEFGVSLGDVSSTLEKVGIQVLDQQGNLRDMGNVIEEVAGKWGTWTEAQQQAVAIAIAGKRQYNNLLALFENWDMYESSLETSKGAEGTLQKQNEIYLESTAAHLKELTAAGEKFKDALFNNESMNEFIDGLTWVVELIGSMVQSFGGGNVILSTLSTAGILLSDKIGPSFVRILSNIKIAKENNREFLAQQQLVTEYANASDEAIKKAVETKKIELKYSKLLTEEERERLNLAIKGTIAGQNKKEDLEQQHNEAIKLAKSLGVIGEKTTVDNNTEITEQNRAKKNNRGLPTGEGLVTSETVAIGVQQKTDQLKDDFKDKFGSKQKSAVGIDQSLKSAKEKLKISKNDEKIQKKIADLEAQKNKLQKDQSTYARKLLETKRVTNKDDIKALQEIAAGKVSTTKAEQQLKITVENIVQAEEKCVKTLQKQKAEMDKLNNEEAEREKIVKEIEKAKKKEQLASDITKTISAIGSLVSAYGALQNIIATIGDESISTEEKITGTITSAIMLIGVLAPVVKTFFTMAKAQAAGLNKALGVIGIILTALVVGISLISGLVKALNKPQETASEKAQKAYEKAAKEADAARQKVGELKNEYNSLIADIEKYQNAQKALDEMKKGTDEWKESVADLNMQVLDLINKYDGLAQYTTFNEEKGVYEIAQEGWDNLINEKKTEINRANANALYASIEKEEKKRDKYDARIYDTFVNKKRYLYYSDNSENANIIRSLGGKEMESGSSRSGSYSDAYSEAYRYAAYDVESVIEGLKEKSNQELIDLQNQIAESDKYSDDLKEAILATSKEILQTREGIKASEDATKKLTEAYIRATFSDDLGEQGAAIFANLTSDIDVSKAQNKGKLHGDIKDALGMGWFFRDHGVVDASEEQNAVKNAIAKAAKAAFGEDAVVDHLSDYWRMDYTTIMNSSIEVNGKKIKISDLMQSENAAEAEKYIEKQSGNLYENLKTLNEKGANVNAAYFLRGEDANQWSGASVSEATDLKNISEEDFDALGLVDDDGNAISYNDFINNIDTFIGEYKDQLGTILSEAGYSYTNQFMNFTKEDAENFVQNIDKATIAGADNLIKGLFQGKDAAATDFINDALSKVNFSDISSVNEFLTSMIEQGYITDTNFAQWETFFNNTILNGMKQWINDSQQVIDNLAAIKDIAENIKIGDIISDEDYKRLLAINPLISGDFVKTADGYVALSTGSEISSKLKTPYSSLSNVSSEYSQIKNAAITKGVKGDLYLNVDESSDLYNYLNKFNTNSDADKKLLDAAGLTGEFSTLLTGIKDGSPAAISEGKVIAKNLNQLLLDVENGEFDAGAAIQLYGTSVATGWSDVEKSVYQTNEKGEFVLDEIGNKQLIDGTTKDDVQKVEQYWRNEYREEMGLAGAATLENLGMGALEDQVKRVKKLEQDRYGEIEKSINKLGKEAEKAFGINKITKLASIAEKSEMAIDVARDRAADAKINADNFLSTTDLSRYGWKPEKPGDLPTLEDLQNLQLDFAKDSDEYLELQDIIDAMVLAEDLENEVFDKVSEAVNAGLAVFDATIQMKLDFETAKRDWNEFVVNYVDRTGKDMFQKLGATEAAEIARYNVESYLSESQAALDNYTALANLGDSDSRIAEKLNEYANQAKTSFENAYNAAMDMLKAYEDIQKEIVEQYEEQIEKISTLNDLYSKSVELLKLVGNNTNNYSTQINGFNQKIQENAVKRQGLAKEELEAAQAAFITDPNTGKSQYDLATDEQKKILDENLSNASSAFIEATTEVAEIAMTLFRDGFASTVENAFNGGLTNLSEEWERELYFDDRYLDDTNKAYKISELENKIQKSIDSTDSYSAQKKLNDLKEQELEILRKKDKLTQDDLDRANARYELELKRIALEEAQQTASKMKLVRDASGNYSYQYVADQDTIDKAQEEYDKAENDLYNLEKNQEKSLVENIMSSYQDAIEAIGSAQTAEQKQALYDYYFGEDGVISLLEKDLEALVGEDLGTSKYKNIVEKLMTADTATIGSQFSELMGSKGVEGVAGTGFIGAMESINNTLSEAFNDQNGILTTALTNLNESIKTADVLDYKDLVKEGTDILKTLFGENSEFAKIFEKLPTEIAAALNEAANLKEGPNIKALNDNTTALQTLTQVLIEDRDISDDGARNGTVEGWSLGDDGLYTQSSET